MWRSGTSSCAQKPCDKRDIESKEIEHRSEDIARELRMYRNHRHIHQGSNAIEVPEEERTRRMDKRCPAGREEFPEENRRPARCGLQTSVKDAAHRNGNSMAASQTTAPKAKAFCSAK
jgi:hypothetical protein